jgi:hypothetical protein
MSHMSEIALAKEEGRKLTRHECHDGTKRWICTSCLANNLEKDKVAHVDGCPHAPRSHPVKKCVAYIESCGWKSHGRMKAKGEDGKWSFGSYYFKRADPDCKAFPSELTFTLHELREAMDVGF